ncbi:MAG TPA: phospholipid scramblase-related protein [Streptosporangiaceae bacterium]|nr:phospholipid scramblase-related protein [Streptosporangiaceae bacterium]
MDDPFDFPALRVQQPGKLLPDRARYEIFDHQHVLVAIATETEAHTRMKLLAKEMPDARVLAVTTAASEPLLTLVKHTRERITELHGPEGELLGRVRTGGTNRNYSLLDGQGQTVGKAVGDLALKHFAIIGPDGSEFARVRKTWAGVKEMLTPSDHYKVEFIAPAVPSARTLTVMLAIVLDLTSYGPV